jgi:hypothetical protein
LRVSVCRLAVGGSVALRPPRGARRLAARAAKAPYGGYDDDGTGSYNVFADDDEERAGGASEARLNESRLSDAVAATAGARIDLARSLARERQLEERINALQAEVVQAQAAAAKAAVTVAAQVCVPRKLHSPPCLQLH